MADGPRCKRRKQANPKRSSVTNFNNGLEASSDSDDEDKLHIVEEDSLQEPEAATAAAATAATEGAPPQDSHDDAAAVLPHNGLNGVKEECVSEEEEEVKDTLVEEILQQGDTAIIYPEAPEDEQSPAETGGADENGTPDSFSALHTCPYCSRGYKRNASLKEHIKYRHETSEDNYSCSHCSYTFTYRSQLERHMSHHRGSREQRQISQSAAGGLAETGGTRKFKCTECFKAFKYKHHLKEHLRIHSGEKPYECSNCKKRFSHSGSYSSHISSKKCVAAAPVSRAPRALIKTTPTAAQVTQVLIAPSRGVLKEKPESKPPLQEQLPLTQIKAEPVEYECKPSMAATAVTTATAAATGASRAPAVVPAAAVPQGVAMVVPTVGLVSPISINLNDLQNVLKVAMDGNVLRQVLGGANGAAGAPPGAKQSIVVQQPQQQIISLPAFVDHDGTTKIIINYSIGPAPATTAVTRPAPLAAKTNAAPTTAAAAPTPTRTDRAATPDVADLSIVKTEPDSEAEAEAEAAQAEAEPAGSHAQIPDSNSTCLLCDDCPENLEALHLLQHQKAANGEAVDSAALDPSFADLLSEAGVTLAEPPVDDLLSLLKAYFASNAHPDQEELLKISQSVSIPLEVVRKWFVKMNSGKRSRAEAGGAEPAGGDRDTPTKASAGCGSPAPPGSGAEGLVIVKSEPEEAEITDSQAEPLDLSLPKHLAELASQKSARAPPRQQDKPLNLACLRKDGQTIYVAAAPPPGNPVNIVTATQLPTLVAIAGQGPVGCLGTIGGGSKRTILIPQLTYTYTTAAKTVVLNGHKETSQDSSSEGVAAAEEPGEAELAIFKKRRLENGVYPCDLCSKVFQKGSSLLRHKYEHTGKRPHECSICKKAFKHKHHLIEHSRLHSGEKPYQCDKCGKRFSHSGSYSQHMNHRYSYCKKDGLSSAPSPGPRGGPLELSSPGAVPPSDSPTTTPPSQLDSDERESEEEEEEGEEDEDEAEAALCMDDIRVVQVDDGECEIYEGNFEEEEEEEDEEGAAGEETGGGRMEEGEVVGEVLEIKLGDDHVQDEEMEEVEEAEEGAETDASIREAEDGAAPTEDAQTETETDGAAPTEDMETDGAAPAEDAQTDAE